MEQSNEEVLYSSDPKGLKFPLIQVKNLEKEFKIKRVRVKHYLYYAIAKASRGKSLSLLEWDFIQRKIRYVRFQLPNLYLLVTKLLLQMKKKDVGEWHNHEFFWYKSQTWFDRATLRTAHGIAKDKDLSERLRQLDKLFHEESDKLVRNRVLLELGVQELKQLRVPVKKPQFKRGYDDKGHMTPEHEKRPKPEDPGEPNNSTLAFGEDPESDIEVLELLSPSELSFYQKTRK